MNRDQVKAAADALGRLEALEEAIRCADFAPHDALPVSFVSVPLRESSDGEIDRDDWRVQDAGIKAYYPREDYRAVLELLAQRERATLGRLGVDQ